jgi:antitoxin VapB
MKRDLQKPFKAKLFRHGGSQAVRLPKQFRMPGTEVTVRTSGRGILIEPASFDIDTFFRDLDAFNDVPFMPGGREQPALPEDEAGHLFEG